MSRILIAEDSPTQRQQLRLILSSEGFEVEVARDGQEALDQLQQRPFDLLVSDIMMPRLNGYELCRLVKASSATQHIPILLLTELADPQEIFRSLESGADSFVSKPYEPSQLVERVRWLLALPALRAEADSGHSIPILFMGKRFNIDSSREQILNLLVSTFEDVVRTNRDLKASQAALASAKSELERYARALEADVRASNEKYWGLMEQAGDAILILDQSGAILELNQQAEQMLGRPRAELEGTSFVELAPKPDRELLESQIQELYGTGFLRGGNAVFQGSGGQPVQTELSATAVRAGGRSLALIIARDVTERRMLERQLLQSQKMEAIGLLAGGIAHDFNNQLGVISQYSEVLSELLGAQSPLIKYVQQIKKTVDQSAALTRQLLAFSRQQQPQLKVLDLNAVVEDTSEMLRRVLTHTIDLSMALGQRIGQIQADPGNLNQVLMNLVINARDAMPRGGRITLSTGEVLLDEDYTRLHVGVRPGRYAMLAVADTGLGMDETTLARIFEPFFTTKEPGKGTGLGLSTVFGIVQQSGGHIQVDSVLGQGTTFRVYFPQPETPPKPPASAPV